MAVFHTEGNFKAVGRCIERRQHNRPPVQTQTMQTRQAGECRNRRTVAPCPRGGEPAVEVIYPVFKILKQRQRQRSAGSEQMLQHRRVSVGTKSRQTDNVMGVGVETRQNTRRIPRYQAAAHPVGVPVGAELHQPRRVLPPRAPNQPHGSCTHSVEPRNGGWTGRSRRDRTSVQPHYIAVWGRGCLCERSDVLHPAAGITRHLVRGILATERASPRACSTVDRHNEGTEPRVMENGVEIKVVPPRRAGERTHKHPLKRNPEGDHAPPTVG